jgi:hypothetical protein
LVLSDDVNDSIDDGTEFDENYVKMTEGDPACAVDARSDGYSCNEMDATDSFFQCRGQDEVGKVKCTQFDADGQIFCENCPGLLAKQGKPLRPSKQGNVSLQMKFYITLFDIQISIFLSNLT